MQDAIVWLNFLPWHERAAGCWLPAASCFFYEARCLVITYIGLTSCSLEPEACDRVSSIIRILINPIESAIQQGKIIRTFYAKYDCCLRITTGHRHSIVVDLIVILRGDG